MSNYCIDCKHVILPEQKTGFESDLTLYTKCGCSGEMEENLVTGEVTRRSLRMCYHIRNPMQNSVSLPEVTPCKNFTAMETKIKGSVANPSAPKNFRLINRLFNFFKK